MDRKTEKIVKFIEEGWDRERIMAEMDLNLGEFLYSLRKYGLRYGTLRKDAGYKLKTEEREKRKGRRKYDIWEGLFVSEPDSL